MRRKKRRGGTVLILVAFSLFSFLLIAALAIDMSFLYATQAELQITATAASTAATTELPDASAARAAALEYANKNMDYSEHGEVLRGRDITAGHWDFVERTFTPFGEPRNAVHTITRRSSANENPAPLFFSNVIGRSGRDLSAEAIAARKPRDIMLVLDYSSSMNDDSELRHINRLGRAAIEANLLQIYRDLGSPDFGNMEFQPRYISSTNSRTLRRRLELDDVPYPYPPDDWSDYFRYVQNNSSVRDAGYRRHYGYLTLINFWMQDRPLASETPGLWDTSAQPVTAVKDAVGLFLNYLQQGNTGDRVGFVLYTHPTDGSRLEAPLTHDLGFVELMVRQRQAGHYMHYTNIGAGLRAAREELEENARDHASKLIVLMTDGKANRPSSDPDGYLRSQAQEAAERGYPVLTISLGADADSNLMQEVADITAGIHFNIPGNQTVSEYEDDLNDVFSTIAAHQPTQLVK